GRAVEITITALHQPRKRDGTLARRTAKRVKCGQAPCRIDVKDGALKVRATEHRRAVEIAVAALHQPSDWISAFAGRAAERVKCGQASCRIDLEDGALKVRPA